MTVRLIADVDDLILRQFLKPGRFVEDHFHCVNGVVQHVLDIGLSDAPNGKFTRITNAPELLVVFEVFPQRPVGATGAVPRHELQRFRILPLAHKQPLTTFAPVTRRKGSRKATRRELQGSGSPVRSRSDRGSG